MTSFVVVWGLLFWLAGAFAGSRRSFLNRRGPLYHCVSNLRDHYPLPLTVGTVACLSVCVVFVRAEMQSIDNFGTIGANFLLSVVFGVLGVFGLSGHLFIETD